MCCIDIDKVKIGFFCAISLVLRVTYLVEFFIFYLATAVENFLLQGFVEYVALIAN